MKRITIGPGLALPRSTRGNVDRRKTLCWVAGVGVGTFIGCNRNGTNTPVGDRGGSSSDAACPTVPEETAGPFAADGSSDVDAFSLTGIVRRDIRSSLGEGSQRADGVPLRVEFQLTRAGDACTPLSRHAVYVWHCDRTGAYSMYGGAAENATYLRGVQSSDGDGVVLFDTIVPGCYPGRWPHIHFEVYASEDEAFSGDEPLATSQLALTEASVAAAYTTLGYEQSSENLRSVTLAGDSVFSDGISLQLAETSGDAERGFEAALTVSV